LAVAETVASLDGALDRARLEAASDLAADRRRSRQRHREAEVAQRHRPTCPIRRAGLTDSLSRSMSVRARGTHRNVRLGARQITFCPICVSLMQHFVTSRARRGAAVWQFHINRRHH
jgi:hypothetical protein